MPLKLLSLKGEFAKNTLTLSVGTAIAQAFPIVFYPILGRLYSPSEFGLLATLSAITAILVVVGTAKYEGSILIAETKSDAANIIGFTLILSFITLLFAYFILLLMGNLLTVWLKEPDIKLWLIVCPVSAFVIIIFNCYNEWCVKNKYYLHLATNKITNAAATTLGKLMFAFISLFGNGLVIGDVAGRIISASGCTYRFLKYDKPYFMNVSFKGMRMMALRYIEFPKYFLPAQILNTVGFSLPVFLIGSYFNSKEVGYYAMTLNVLSVPMSVLSLAIRDVFRQRAQQEYQQNGNCRDIYNRLFRLLGIWSFTGTLLIFFLLPQVFSIALGSQWKIAGEYSQILLPMMAINFIGTALEGVLIISEKLKSILIWQIYYVFITVASLLLSSIIWNDIKVSLIFFSVGRSTAYIYYIYLSYKYSKGKSPIHVQ